MPTTVVGGDDEVAAAAGVRAPAGGGSGTADVAGEACRARRSRRGVLVRGRLVIGRMVRGRADRRDGRATPSAGDASGLRADPREEVRSRSRVQHVGRGHPAAARLGDAPARVVELAGVVGVRIDREDAAGRDRPAGALGGQVEPMRRAVHLEGRPVRGGGRVDGLPVEIEIVAGLDHPPGGVGDDVDVGAADRVQRPLRQLGPRLAAGDVDRGDDDVEPGEQVVVVVELAVGADLELAAVEQAEALRRRLRRRRPGRLLGGEPGVQLGDDRPLLLDPLGGQAVRDRERLGVVGQDLVLRSRAGGRPRP